MTITRSPRIGVGFCVHNEEEYIGYSLRAVYDFATAIAVSVNTGIPWGGEYEELDSTLDIVRCFPDPVGKIRVQTGAWPGEIEQRNANLDLLRADIDYYMIVDADEIYTRRDLEQLKGYIRWHPYAGQFRIRLTTYWKTNPFHRIDPPEPLRAYILSRVRSGTRFVDLRRTNEAWRMTIPRKVAVCHHFSYARSSEKILRKIRNFSHREAVVPGWYKNVWLAWDTHKEMTDLHPTNPPEYKRAVKVDVADLPECMRDHPYAVPA